MRTLALLVPLTLALAACQTGGSTPAPSSSSAAESGDVRTIDIEAFAAEREAGKVATLVDVRTPGEFARGHVPGAVNVPLDTLPGTLDAYADKGEVHVICQSGGRSARAAAMMAEHGIDAVNIAGGTGAWQAAGKPVE